MRVEGEVGPQGDIAEREVAVRCRARLGSPIVYFGVDAGVLGNTKLGCTTHFMESLTAGDLLGVTAGCLVITYRTWRRRQFS